MDTKRIHWIDIAKGFFIIAIVLGHIFNSGYLRNWLFSFHVPAFFFLSGYCFKYESSIGNFVLKKFRTIVVPYLLFSMLSILAFYFASQIIPSIQSIMECDILENVITMLYGNSKPDVMKYNSPLWFLPCLFSVTVLAYGVEWLVKRTNAKVRYIAMLCSVVIGAVVNKNEGLRLPWHIETALSILVWFLLGIRVREYISSHKDKIKNLLEKQTVLPYVLILAGGGISFLNIRTVGIRNDHYGIIPIYYLSALLGLTGFVLLSRFIKENKILEYIGKNSLAILVIHKFPILVFQEMIPLTKRLLNQPNTISGFFCGLSVLVISLVVSLLCGNIIKRLFPWALGIRNTG